MLVCGFYPCCGTPYITLYTTMAYYHICSNFCEVKLLQIVSFCDFRVFIFCESRISAIFAFAPSSQPLPLERKNLLRAGTSRHLGTKNHRTGILELPINARTRRNDPVTAHTWTYKRFLSSSRIQLTVVSMKIPHLYRN